MRYLTPAILRAAGSGLALTAFTDGDLGGVIAEAEALIDAYVAFREDQSLGFSAGLREERHRWDPVHRRVYPHCFPVPVKNSAAVPISLFEIVVSQSSADGSNISAKVPWELLVVNNDQGYIEPISLSVIAYGLTPVIAQLSIIQPFAHLQYQAGYEIAKAGYRLASADNLTFNSFLPAWDTAAQTPVVYVNGAVQASGYSVNAQDGQVVFSATTTGVVTANFTHSIPDVVVQAARVTAVERLEQVLARQAGMAGFRSLSLAGQLTAGRADDPDGLPERAKRLLAPYRRLNF